MQNRNFITIICFCLILSGISLYYIFFISASVSPKVKVNGIEYNINEDDNLESKLNNILISNLATNLLVNFEYETITIPTSDLNINVKKSVLDQLSSADPQKILAVVTDEAIDIDFNVDAGVVIAQLPYKFGEQGSIGIYNGELEFCSDKIINSTVNIEQVEGKIKQAIKNNRELNLSLADIVNDKDQIQLVNYCNEYLNNVDKLSNVFNYFIDWNRVLRPTIENGKLTIGIEDPSYLESTITDYSYINQKTADNGDYFEKAGIAYFTRLYEYGRELDVNKTITNITNWLVNSNIDPEILEYRELAPEVLSLGFEIVDVSQKIGIGYSRLDVYRDGAFNYRVPNSQAPLWALNNFILEPSKEFSFHRDSGVAFGLTRSGNGVCNATTTLFRAALEAGLEITDRSPHTTYVDSYSYGPYPINIVEATFFGGPVVDFKFRNDLSHPVIFKILIDRRDDGYQYHTVEFFTSPEEPARDVELTDWKQWDIRDSRHFKGSFTRIVKLDGKIIKEDTYTSNYYQDL